MAADALSVLQATTTKAATFASTSFDLRTMTPAAGLIARVIYSAATNASGANGVTFSVEHSGDNSAWSALASGAKDVLALSTTAQAGELFIPFITRQRYVRLVATFAGAGATPSITYIGQIVLTQP